MEKRTEKRIHKCIHKKYKVLIKLYVIDEKLQMYTENISFFCFIKTKIYRKLERR